MLDLNQIVAFARVVKEQGFAAAARSLGMPKSTVSKRVAELEDRLGVRLLQRSTRKLALTDAGARYYERCSRMLAELAEAEQALMRDAEAPRGLLRISAPQLFGQAFLAPVVLDYLRLYPEVEVEVALADRRVDLIEEGFDMAIRAGVPEDSSLISRRLGQAETRCVAGPAYLAARGAPRVPADVRRHACIAHLHGYGEPVWSFERAGERVTVELRPRYCVNAHGLLRDAALAGLGLTCLPTFLVAADLAAGRLVTVLPEWTLPRTELHALYPSSRHLAPRVRALLDLLVQRFGDDPPWAARAPARSPRRS